MFRWFLAFLITCLSLQVHAFEDCIITNNGKLTDISIEDNSIVNVYPLVTVMNEKNTLIISPLKTGKTRFCVLKNNKDIVMFNIEVTEDKTIIDEVNGFEILTLDIPEEDFSIDLPPGIKEAD